MFLIFPAVLQSLSFTSFLLRIPSSIYSFSRTSYATPFSQYLRWNTSPTKSLTDSSVSHPQRLNGKVWKSQPSHRSRRQSAACGRSVYCWRYKPRGKYSWASSLPAWLNMQSCDWMDLIKVRTVQIFNSFKSVNYFYLIWSLERPLHTFGKLMIVGCYFLDNHAMSSDSHAHTSLHSQFCLNVTAVWSCSQRKRLQIWIKS